MVSNAIRLFGGGGGGGHYNPGRELTFLCTVMLCNVLTLWEGSQGSYYHCHVHGHNWAELARVEDLKLFFCLPVDPLLL